MTSSAPALASRKTSALSVAWLQVSVMVVLFALSAVIQSRTLSSLTSLENADIWWHLRTGIWILQNHAVPHDGLFSQSENLFWISPSWAYEVSVALAFKAFGLAAIPLLAMFIKAGLAVLTFILGGGLRGRFWLAALLSAVAQFVLGSVQPEPIYCSILLFAAELALLISYRGDGNIRRLYWLAPIFLLWANLDVQFVFGIAALLLFVIGRLFQGRIDGSNAKDHSALLSVMAACVVASVFTPYFCKPYAEFYRVLTSSANQYFPELHAMSFHRPQDYLLLLLAMSAFLVIGMRRSRDLFQIALLVGTAALSFHSQSNIWLVALAAIAVIGDDKETITVQANSRSYLVSTALAGVVVLIAAASLPPSRTLIGRVSETYPVAASNYVRDHALPQPLFNAAEWGGFLAWHLPEYPVAIDGRRNLYPDEFVIQYAKAMNAELRYTDFPAMANARTLVFSKTSLMGQALSTVSSYTVAYSDNVAVVLVRKD